MPMPELPEVSTIAKQLNEIFPMKISSCTLSEVANSIVHTPITNMKNVVIEEVQRKGKMLNFILSDGRHLLSHLGMTGSWRISDKKLNLKHTHLQFKGEHNGKTIYLAYIDPRRFGHMYLFNHEQAQTKLDELGIDLKSPKFTLDYFQSSLQKYPERFIKVSLLDQSLFAGTGNYIANEICARAGVLPQRKVSSITKNEYKKLYNSVAVVIDGATQTGGTTFQGGYADTTGSKGNGVGHLVVFYQKICQLCSITPVTKITLGQRGTYYCSRCQK